MNGPHVDLGTDIWRKLMIYTYPYNDYLSIIIFICELIYIPVLYNNLYRYLVISVCIYLKGPSEGGQED